MPKIKKAPMLTWSTFIFLFLDSIGLYHSTKHCMRQSPDVCFYPVPAVYPRFVSGADLGIGGFILYCKHTSLRGCGCAFWSLWTSTYLNGRPSVIINFKCPVKWFEFINIIKVYHNELSHNFADYFSPLIIIYFQKIKTENLHIFWAERVSHLMTHKNAHYWIWINIENASGICFMFLAFVHELN